MQTIEQVQKMFIYAHLPDNLSAVSKPFHDLAVQLFETLPACAETTLALRNLWDSKNYAVWVAANTTH